jgi:hypothetical protein
MQTRLTAPLAYSSEVQQKTEFVWNNFDFQCGRPLAGHALVVWDYFRLGQRFESAFKFCYVEYLILFRSSASNLSV